MLRTICALGILMGSVLSSCPAGGESDPLLEAVLASTPAEELTIEAAPVPAAAPALAEPTSTVAAELPAPVDIYKAVLYTLRRTPADELIRIVWRGPVKSTVLSRLRRRESGLRCDAGQPALVRVGTFSASLDSSCSSGAARTVVVECDRAGLSRRCDPRRVPCMRRVVGDRGAFRSLTGP